MTDVSSAIECFQRGGVLLYPTNTLFGLGGDGRKESVHTRIRSIKGRQEETPFLVLLQSIEQVSELVAHIPSTAQQIMETLWPGDITLLLPARENLPDTLVGPEGLVGVRLATHPVPTAILKHTNGWLLSTSANWSGSAPPTTVEEIPAEIRESVDCVALDGPVPLGIASTIVAVTNTDTPQLLREGAVSYAQINAVVDSN